MSVEFKNIHDPRIAVVGISHQTAALEVLEKCALKDEQSTLALRELKHRQSVIDGFILSTCNRVEVYAVGQSDEVFDEVHAFFMHWFGERHEASSAGVYIKKNDDALRHLFAVAGSLDAMVLGEAQILGQVKEAFNHSLRSGDCHPVLDGLLRKTISVAKRIRTETGVAKQTVSLAKIAVDLSEKIFGELNQRRAMLIGAGEMGGLAAKHLQKQGIAELIICNRSYERASELANELGANAIQWEHLSRYFSSVDIVLVSTGASEYVVGVEDVRDLMHRRKNAPIFFVDIAMPRNVDPEVNSIANAYLYNIEDLKQVSEENMKHRQEELASAKQIVDQEVVSFGQRLKQMRFHSTAGELSAHFETIVRSEMIRIFSQVGGVDGDLKHNLLEQSIKSLVQKLLFHPSQYLKAVDPELEAHFRKIFGLADSDDKTSNRNPK